MPFDKRFETSKDKALYQELPLESWASTLLKATGTPKPFGYPATPASWTNPVYFANPPNEGFGPEGRKKLNAAGVLTNEPLKEDRAAGHPPSTPKMPPAPGTGP